MTDEPIHVLDKRVRLLQPEEGFRTSMDAVMLAAACPARAGERVLDLGCGVGAAGFCVLHRVPGTALAGIDLDEDVVELASRNAALNDMEARARFFRADIRDYRGEEADHAICNPPFLEAGTHTVSPVSYKARAKGHQAEDTTLQDWIDAAFFNLKPLGSLTLIHRADHTDRIVQGLGKRFGALEIIPLWPKAGAEAKRVIIRAVKNRKSPARIHPGLILHTEDGGHTPEAERILRGGEGLFLPASFHGLSVQSSGHRTGGSMDHTHKACDDGGCS